MANSKALRRLKRDLQEVRSNPMEEILLEPDEENMLEWHYVLMPGKGGGSGGADGEGKAHGKTGKKKSAAGRNTTVAAANCVYAGGYYWGRIKFPKDYPMKPPAIYMTTPSGRFATETRLCLSISDYHVETWNPLWRPPTIAIGLLSFMLEEAPTAGSIWASKSARRKMARDSLRWNCQHDKFRELFPDLAAMHDEADRKRSASASGVGSEAGEFGDGAEEKKNSLESEGNGVGSRSCTILFVSIAVVAVAAMAYVVTGPAA